MDFGNRMSLVEECTYPKVKWTKISLELQQTGETSKKNYIWKVHDSFNIRAIIRKFESHDVKLSYLTNQLPQTKPTVILRRPVLNQTMTRSLSFHTLSAINFKLEFH